MRRLTGRAALAAGAALAVVGACSPKDNGTLLVVRVDTDLAVPTQINSVEIVVDPDRGDTSTDTRPVASNAALPVTLGLRPKGNPSFGVQVTARGLLGKTVVVTQTATVQFVPGKAVEFTMLLSGDCSTGGACKTEEVCIKGPRCVAKADVAQLREYVPGDGGQDAGMDRGSVADAPAETPVDRPGDTGVPETAGDTGSPMDGGGAVEARPNPGSWVSVPGVPATVSLSAIWPNSDRDVWAAGAQAAGVVVHYDGTTWNPSAIPIGTPALYGLWGASNGDVWAVGAAGTVLHLANNTWQSMKVATMAGAQAPTLSAIWGAKPDDIWIVGSGGRIYHIDGTGTITSVPSGVTVGLFAVSGAASANGVADVWAVGGSGTILHFAGGAWTPATQALTQSILYGVWTDGPSDVWVSGDRTVLRWNGSSWKAVPGSVDVSLAIWGSAADDIWTVGRPAAGGPTIARFDGVAFTGSAEGGGSTLQAVRGLNSMSVWAAGAAGAVFHFQSR